MNKNKPLETTNLREGKPGLCRRACRKARGRRVAHRSVARKQRLPLPPTVASSSGPAIKSARVCRLRCPAREGIGVGRWRLGSLTQSGVGGLQAPGGAGGNPERRQRLPKSNACPTGERIVAGHTHLGWSSWSSGCGFGGRVFASPMATRTKSSGRGRRPAPAACSSIIRCIARLNASARGPGCVVGGGGPIPAKDAARNRRRGLERHCGKGRVRRWDGFAELRGGAAAGRLITHLLAAVARHQEQSNYLTQSTKCWLETCSTLARN